MIRYKKEVVDLDRSMVRDFTPISEGPGFELCPEHEVCPIYVFFSVRGVSEHCRTNA